MAKKATDSQREGDAEQLPSNPLIITRSQLLLKTEAEKQAFRDAGGTVTEDSIQESAKKEQPPTE